MGLAIRMQLFQMERAQQIQVNVPLIIAEALAVRGTCLQSMNFPRLRQSLVVLQAVLMADLKAIIIGAQPSPLLAADFQRMML